jgi:hypothetical protein
MEVVRASRFRFQVLGKKGLGNVILSWRIMSLLSYLVHPCFPSKDIVPRASLTLTQEMKVRLTDELKLSVADWIKELG